MVSKQSEKSKLQIEKRLDRIKDEDHFGHIRNLGDGLVELKFNDGRRIYYTIIPVNNVILLLGGGKMVKTVTSGRRKIGSRRQKKTPKEPNLHLADFDGIGKEHKPLEYLTNAKNIGNAILECLENNDAEGVMEVIATYLEAINKTKFSKTNDLHRQTLYSALKHRNPTVKTLAKIMYNSKHLK